MPSNRRSGIRARQQARLPKRVGQVCPTYPLLGLYVRTRQVFKDNDRRYVVHRGRIDHREVVVIWRDCRGWGKADFERDKKFVAEQKLTEGADQVFVNGDSIIPKARSLAGVFKGRMFSEVRR